MPVSRYGAARVSTKRKPAPFRDAGSVRCFYRELAAPSFHLPRSEGHGYAEEGIIPYTANSPFAETVTTDGPVGRACVSDIGIRRPCEHRYGCIHTATREGLTTLSDQSINSFLDGCSMTASKGLEPRKKERLTPFMVLEKLQYYRNSRSPSWYLAHVRFDQ